MFHVAPFGRWIADQWPDVKEEKSKEVEGEAEDYLLYERIGGLIASALASVAVSSWLLYSLTDRLTDWLVECMHAECASEHDVHGVDDDYRWTGDDDEEEEEEG